MLPHSLLLGGADRGFHFPEDQTRRNFSYLSGTFREHSRFIKLKRKYAFFYDRFIGRACLTSDKEVADSIFDNFTILKVY
jgi:hypothetical protein